MCFKHVTTRPTEIFRALSGLLTFQVQGSANSATVMSTSTRALLYHAYNAALSALDEEEYDQLLEHIKLPKVVAFNVECYPVYSETIATIFDGASRSSLLFAILYKGWPLDSKANPTKVAAIFRKQHSATSTCSGAVVPCHIIDECGLIPQVSSAPGFSAPTDRSRECSLLCTSAAERGRVCECPATQKVGTC